MANVLSLITNSLRRINAIGQGETPSASEAADALARLNLLLEQLSIERANIYTKKRETFPLVAGTQSYTIGSGGNFNTARPVKLDSAKILQPNGLESSLDILNTVEEWEAIPEKAVSAVQPLKLYNDYAWPLSTLYFWPRPLATPSVILTSWQQLTAFATLTTTVSLPPGYQKALEDNLAIELAVEYGKPVDQVLAALALQSRAAIAQMNLAQGLPALPNQPPPTEERKPE